jgi:putative mRNA 3-end processing factor
MRARFGDAAGQRMQAAAYGEEIRIGDVRVRLAPAGHVLGSAQVVLEHAGTRVVVSGDYKRRRDPTCPPFEPQRCDVFVTEATFGLPVFVHPDDGGEVARLLASVARNPERAHLVGVYALGKCQRVIRLLREAGWDAPLFLHGALQPLCALYEQLGVPLGALRPVAGARREELAGAIVLAPPSALADRWSRRLPDPVAVAASGWMRIRQRARQRGVELPLVVSDHADWPELLRTFEEVDAPEIWVTHGQEDALVHAAGLAGRRARALRLVGLGEEDT